MNKASDKIRLALDILNSIDIDNNKLSEEKTQLLLGQTQNLLWDKCCVHSKQSFKYINELFNLRCSPDLLSNKLFPNVKEVTESFAAFSAVRDHLKEFDRNDSSVALIVIGDGATPRTAATFAFRTSWNCYSIDPELKGEYSINRLTIIAKKIEEISIETEKVIIVAVHSHALLENVLKAIKAKQIAIVAIPCCVKQLLINQPYDLHFVDYAILSPQRNIYIWKNIQQ